MRELESYFKGLADLTRLRIIGLLLYGELCGCDIQEVLEMPQPNVSRHLNYLKHAGLVSDRREGFRVFYGLIRGGDQTLQTLFEFLRAAFRRDETLQHDLLRLKEAIKEGACTIQQIRPLPRITAASSLGSSPRSTIAKGKEWPRA